MRLVSTSVFVLLLGAALALLALPKIKSSPERDLEAARPLTDPTPAPARFEAIGTGTSISGVVRIADAPPGEPLVLLLCDETAEYSMERMQIAVPAHGVFVFEGLEVGWKGSIRLPRRYALRGSRPRQRSVSVEAPRPGVVLDVERLHCLTARLVSRSRGEPVEGAMVRSLLTKVQGGQWIVDTEVEPGGRIYIEIPERWAIAALSIEASAPAWLHGEFEFSGPSIPASLDLGDLPLDELPALHLVVLDPERNPIAGARAQASGHPSSVAETDEEGRATLDEVESGRSVTVLARGFDPMVLEGTGVRATVEVVLERATRLSVRVVDSEGQPARDILMHVAASRPPFIGTDETPDRFLVPQALCSGGLGFANQGELKYVAHFETDQDGSIELQSLVPDLPLILGLRDLHTTFQLEHPVAGLRRGEVRELPVKLPRAWRCLVGAVEDGSGHPIEGANIRVDLGHSIASASSASDGRFCIEGLYLDRLNFGVWKSGYVEALRRDMPLQGEPTIIVLEPSRDVRVRVVDERGSPVAGGRFRAESRAEDRSWGANTDAEFGFHDLLDLPLKDLEVRLDLAGKVFSAPLGAHQEALEIRVPVMGRVRLYTRVYPPDHLGLRLGSLDEQGIELSWKLPSLPGHDLPLFPGRYEVGYVTLAKGHWGHSPELIAQGPAVKFQVEAGKTCRIDLP